MAAFAAGAASFASVLSGISAAACAIIVAVAMIASVQHPIYRNGLSLASGPILKLAIALLGTRLPLADMASLGAEPFVIVAITMGLGLAFAFVMARLLGLPPVFGWIGGMSVAVCGVSAAMTAASIFPKSRQIERDVLFSALIVTVLSSLAMVVYPWIADLAGLGDTEAGIFLGATIHDLAQVVGAGYAVSPEAGDAAVITKLIRVAMLAPLVLGAALIFARRGGQDSKVAIPWFLIGFFAMSAARSTGLIPVGAVPWLSQLSGFCFLMAIAAIGMKSHWRDFLLCDRRCLVLLIAHTAVLAGGTLLLLRLI
jgi:uncharacterized integral membrane protein (TIGR00698 family)